MQISDTARVRARSLSAIAAGLSAVIALAAWFGLNERGWELVLPVLASVVAAIWPTRIIVATSMIATAAIVVLGLESAGVLFGASVAALMLALNNLQEAATRVRRRQPAR
jgi:hypothetical protein